MALHNICGNNMLFEFQMNLSSNIDNEDDEIVDPTSISHLSTEILVIVFSYLPIEDLSRLARVNSEWLYVTQDKSLWIPYSIKTGILSKKEKSNPDDNDEYEDLNEEMKVKCIETRAVERNWEKNRYYVQSFKGHGGSIRSVSFLDDLLASGSEDGTVKLWSISSGKCLRTIFGHQGWVYSVQCGNGIVVSGAQDRKVKIWQVNQYFISTCSHTFQGHENSVTTLQFDNNRVVSGSTDKSIKVWDINTGQLISTLLGHHDLITKVQLSGNEIYSSSNDYSAKVWDIRIGDVVSNLVGHKSSVNSVRMDPKSGKLYTASADLTIGVWDMANLQPTFLDGHVWHVHDVDVVDDKLVSVSGDKTIRVWNTETDKCNNIMRDHFSLPIVTLKIDARKIVAGSYDKTIKILHFGKPFI